MSNDPVRMLRSYVEGVRLQLDGALWARSHPDVPLGAIVNNFNALDEALGQLVAGLLGIDGRDASTMTSLGALDESIEAIKRWKKRGVLGAAVAVPNNEDGYYILRLGMKSHRPTYGLPQIIAGDLDDALEYVAQFLAIAETALATIDHANPS